MITYETRAVLAAAFRGTRGVPSGWRPPPASSLLTHTVELDGNGNYRRVLCMRVKLENIADPCSGDIYQRPTCPTCARRDPRFQEGDAS